MSEPRERSVQEMAEEALAEAAHGHHGQRACCASCRASAHRAVALARLAQAETMLDLYWSYSTVTDGPKIEPALVAERDRLRREVDAP